MLGRIMIWLVLGLQAGAAEPAATEPLPPVAAPAPDVLFEHFPDRLHALVWRNWDLVPTARLSRLVGASEEQVNALAASMGLPANRPIAERFRSRAYITLVRRNWHLLPYEQLLELLEMTPEELGFHLREDDVLGIKLGGFKPRCEPIRYREPGPEARRRAAEIKAVVERRFGAALAKPGEERFAFVDRLSRASGDPPAPKDQDQGLRYIYSYFGVFGDPLLDPQLDPYPDGLLEKLAEVGVNGVWLHVVLRQLAPGGSDFPEFGRDHEKRLENLRGIVRRAKRYGMNVYLYMNEPRAQPESFFRGRPEMAGVREGDHIAMCTSDPRVRRWLGDALGHVFRQVPGLGGVFTITASENLTSCASHSQSRSCPRCSKRSEAEILGEVNATIAAGVHRVDPAAKVICWDWGWANHGDAPEFIARMPADAWLMSVSEWSQPFERGGVKGTVGEYSLSVVGPGPRATRHWELARRRGLKIAAKVVFNNTWELSSLPYLPVMDLVAEHCSRLSAARVDGLMLSWSLGGYPSPNLRIAQRVLAAPGADWSGVLDGLAAERFGPDGAAEARRAWTAFSRAFQQFPYGSGLYTAPQQVGPANLLYRKPTGYRATMTCYPYDDLTSWRGAYPVDVLEEQYRKMARGWAEGVGHLERAVAAAPAALRPEVSAELRLARAAGTCWASLGNQVRLVALRDDGPHADGAEREARRRRLLEDEIAQARILHDLAKQDSRIGFEAANQYFYVPLDLAEKVISCQHLLDAGRTPDDRDERGKERAR
ncbi:MAG: hypothetical protein U0790_10150 [Isosphaeraceae bacterium]